MPGQFGEDAGLDLVFRVGAAVEVLRKKFFALDMLEKIGELSTRFTPQKALEDTTRKLEVAGNPGRIDAEKGSKI